MFCNFQQNEFTQEDVLIFLRKYLSNELPGAKIAESSLIKDISCLLRMYVVQEKVKRLKEDSIDSPFIELGLIKNTIDSKHYAFIYGEKTGLDPHIIVYACLDYILGLKVTASTMSISKLLYEPGSPGTVFKLNENILCSAIENISSEFPSIKMSESTGLIQFVFQGEISKIASKILNSYYRRH